MSVEWEKKKNKTMAKAESNVKAKENVHEIWKKSEKNGRQDKRQQWNKQNDGK